jgi:hypothetical protein
MSSNGDKKLKQSLENLQARCLALYALVEAEPQKLGYLKASVSVDVGGCRTGSKVF